MCWSVQQLLILVTLGRLSCGGDEAELSVSCPGHQRASEGSCYEFVAQERSFSGAQACCEERGGHLAFVPNKDTQHFLQRHLDPEKDVWLGVALSASPNLQYSATVGGKRGEMWNTLLLLLVTTITCSLISRKVASECATDKMEHFSKIPLKKNQRDY